MKIIKPHFKIEQCPSYEEALRVVESCARTCYKSESKSGDNTAESLIRNCIKRKHESVIEHCVVSVRFIMSRGVTHELVRSRLASYCLSGDTVIKSIANKQWTIERLYEMQEDRRTSGIIKRIQARSVNGDGIIVPNKIKRIIDSGLQEVFCLTTESGRSIKATAKHKFLTPDGFRQLGELCVGQFVISNGVPAIENKKWIIEHYITQNKTRKAVAKLAGVSETALYKAFLKFGIKKPWSNRPNRKPGHGKKGMFSDEQRKKMSEGARGSKNNAWQPDATKLSESGARTRINRAIIKSFCECCGKTDCRLENHHIDKNPKNISLDNIKTLCVLCHKAFHKIGTLTIIPDRIISIVRVGMEHTYDIEMVDEPHNFVANGIVVHNSQESTRFVCYGGKDMEFIQPYWISDAIAEALFDGKKSRMIEVSSELAQAQRWLLAMTISEQAYNELLKGGLPPQAARGVLPNDLKTEIVMTANLRQLRWMIQLRSDISVAGKPHPDIAHLFNGLLLEMKERLPVFFEDLQLPQQPSA